MRKHRKLLIALVCLAVVAGVVILLSRDDEPHYQGRSLSEWLQGAAVISDESDNIAAHNAVRAIGTNAIPSLLRWIRAKPAPWHKTAVSAVPRPLWRSEVGDALTGSYDRARVKHYRALTGFRILRTNAAPAVSQLAEIMTDTTHPDAARNSIIALSLIGTPAIPTLTGAFSDTNYPMRDVVFCYLLDLDEPNWYRSHLEAALVDPDPRVRSIATYALEQLKYLALTNAPAK